jgi:hypothetical protein
VEALDLARTGDCSEVRWNNLSTNFQRCVAGVWTDLLVFGVVRGLTRQGLRWRTGEEADSVLTALSIGYSDIKRRFRWARLEPRPRLHHCA